MQRSERNGALRVRTDIDCPAGPIAARGALRPMCTVYPQRRRNHLSRPRLPERVNGWRQLVCVSELKLTFRSVHQTACECLHSFRFALAVGEA